MYDPVAGILLSEDPLGFDAGDPNETRYVGNSPTNATDPSGLYYGGAVAEADSPNGTKDNNYNGLGEWTFKNEKEVVDFLNTLLQPDKNNFPDDWQNVAKDGCVGIAMLRAGWDIDERRPRNALFLPGSTWFPTMNAAQAMLEKLQQQNPGTKYIIIAAQIPVNGNPAAITNALGEGPINPLTNVAFNKAINLGRLGRFNFGTWFPTGEGNGYWEYMNHHWGDENDFAPDDCPYLKHSPTLPPLKGTITLYGVVPVTPFPKRTK